MGLLVGLCHGPSALLAEPRPLEPFGDRPSADCAAFEAGQPGEPRQPGQAGSEPAADGPEDVFVFLDASLSMGPTSFGPWATGYMEPARRLLRTLAACHLDSGDFFLVATFDSTARLDIAKELRSERDRHSLLRQIDALEPGRAKYFGALENGRPVDEAMPPRPGERARSQILGGSWKTDLGAMLHLAAETLETYSDPAHQQVVLIFTDGEDDPPAFSSFRPGGGQPSGATGGAEGLRRFLARDDLAHRNVQIGVVALPTTGDRPAQPLASLFEQIDPDGHRRRAGGLALLTPESERPADSFLDQLTELLRRRVVLHAPGRLTLGRQVEPWIDAEFHLRNDTELDRTIEFAGAAFESAAFEGTDGRRVDVDLVVTPRTLRLPPRSAASVHVAGSLDQLPTGPLEGTLRFDFASSVRFHPSSVPVRGVHESWLARYGLQLQLAAVGCVFAGLGLLAWWRRPVWLAAVWTDGEVTRTSSPRRLGIGRTLSVGAPGFAQLGIPGTDGRFGHVRREGRDDLRIVLDGADPLTAGLRREGGSGREPDDASRSVAPGAWHSVPGRDGERVAFHWATSRRALSRRLSSRTPGRDGLGGLYDDFHDDFHDDRGGFGAPR